MSTQPSGGNNPFGDRPEYAPNPYATPTGGYDARPPVSSDFARQLRVPAIALLILSALTVLYRVGDLIYTTIFLSNNPNPNLPPGVMIGALVGTSIVLIMNGTVLLGSIAMLRMTSHGLARTAAVLALIPVCSPGFLLGIPFGVWALVILSKPDCAVAFNTASVPMRPY